MDPERRLSEAFVTAHPEDAARVLERLPPEEAARFAEEFPADVVSQVLPRMAPLIAAECLTRTRSDQAGRILAALPLDLSAALLRPLGPEARDRVLSDAPPELSRPLGLLLRHAPETAGGLMDPAVLALPDDLTVGEARVWLRRAPRQVLCYLYVVDRARALVGVLNLGELMLASPNARLASVMRPGVTSIPARADRQAILAHPGWRTAHALPVVDQEDGTFLGVIRYETVRGLEEGAEPRRGSADALALILALSEVLWVGASGLLQGVAAVVSERQGGEADYAG